MAEKLENYFKLLYDIDVREKVKSKNNLNYLSWAAAWAEIKKVHPNATYNIYERTTEEGLVINYFTDGRTCWVKTGVIINGLEHIEELPVMDFRNKAISLESVTSCDVNKAIQRSLTKACARHGLGLYIYEGEDIPEETKTVAKLQEECMALIKKKSTSEVMTKKVGEICKSADEEANGNPRLITDSVKLGTLKKALMAIR